MDSGGLPYFCISSNRPIILFLLVGSLSRTSRIFTTISCCFRQFSSTSFPASYCFLKQSMQFWFVSFRGSSSRLLSMNSASNFQAALSIPSPLSKFLNISENLVPKSSPKFYPSSPAKFLIKSPKAAPMFYSPMSSPPEKPPCISFMNFSYSSFILFMSSALSSSSSPGSVKFRLLFSSNPLSKSACSPANSSPSTLGVGYYFSETDSFMMRGWSSSTFLSVSLSIA